MDGLSKERWKRHLMSGISIVTERVFGVRYDECVTMMLDFLRCVGGAV